MNRNFYIYVKIFKVLENIQNEVNMCINKSRKFIGILNSIILNWGDLFILTLTLLLL